MKVYFYDLVEKLALGNAIKCPSMKELLKKSDIVTVRVDGNPKNTNLMSDKEFKMMKHEAFLCDVQNMPNVILTPHIGGSTKEAQENIAQFVSSKLCDFVNAGNTYLSVNIPNIQLPSQGKAHRLIHIHQNMPGVLANINGILARNMVNILGQYLKTDERIGYVITDVSRKYDDKIISEFKKVPHTIKFRVLY